MQITALNGENTRNVTYTTMLQESAVDDNTDGEGEAVRAKEGTAEGQTSTPVDLDCCLTFQEKELLI